MRRKARGPRFLGTVTVAVVLALLLALFLPNNISLGKRTWHAQLAEAGGLKSGDEVRVAGVPVGHVTSLQIRDAMVRATLQIRRSIDLGRDSQANVKVATLLGNHFLEVVPGGGGPLPDRTIPVANTLVPFQVEDIVQAGGAALEELDGAKIRGALKVLSDDFRGTPALTRQALDGISRLSAVVLTRRAQLNTLLQQADNVTANLDANRDSLVQLMQQASLVLAEVTRRRDAIDKLLVDAQAISEQLTGLVRDNQATITPLLAHLDVVLATLRANSDALDQIGILLGPAARYFANVVGNGPYMDINGPDAVFPDSMLCAPQGKCTPPTGGG
ncbi:MAG TPA: MCE family protein [Sporichthyaceae bacterium]|jgi:phospholipid/cholesterol/gamma-HCH transport system substrate-binding protein